MTRDESSEPQQDGGEREEAEQQGEGEVEVEENRSEQLDESDRSQNNEGGLQSEGGEAEGEVVEGLEVSGVAVHQDTSLDETEEAGEDD